MRMSLKESFEVGSTREGKEPLMQTSVGVGSTITQNGMRTRDGLCSFWMSLLCRDTHVS